MAKRKTARPASRTRTPGAARAGKGSPQQLDERRTASAAKRTSAAPKTARRRKAAPPRRRPQPQASEDARQTKASPPGRAHGRPLAPPDQAAAGRHQRPRRGARTLVAKRGPPARPRRLGRPPRNSGARRAKHPAAADRTRSPHCRGRGADAALVARPRPPAVGRPERTSRDGGETPRTHRARVPT